MIYHVPRLISEQCSTALISPDEQSDQPYGLKNRLQKPLFFGSGSTCSGTGMRFSIFIKWLIFKLIYKCCYSQVEMSYLKTK